ncbi:putative cytochrome c oxidase subunit 2 [Allostella sp. ATCC 35155]|nr:putative cytochrome c oxidase subunit 2 [Stella sp. ATCC 35155]
MKFWGKLAALAATFCMVGAGLAVAEQPTPWALGFQSPATPVKEAMAGFHDMLLVIITLITIFVLALLAYVVLRFRADRNPNPSKTTHNTLIEVVWTVVPVLILVIVAIPSFRLLYFLDRNPDAEMTIKVVGHQWYWAYEYPDQDGIKFDSYMIQEADLKEGQKRLLEVDNRLVLPVGTTIRVLVTGNDVMHSWFIPSLGVQNYAFPGRTNETWIRLEREGVFYGQCNQICGVNHGFMPIAIEGVSKEAFQRWVGEAKKKFAHAGPAPVQIARAAE